MIEILILLFLHKWFNHSYGKGHKGLYLETWIWNEPEGNCYLKHVVSRIVYSFMHSIFV